MLERAEKEVARMIDRIVTPFAGLSEEAVRKCESVDRFLAEAEERTRAFNEKVEEVCRRMLEQCKRCEHYSECGPFCDKWEFRPGYMDYVCFKYEERAENARCGCSEKPNS